MIELCLRMPMLPNSVGSVFVSMAFPWFFTISGSFAATHVVFLTQVFFLCKFWRFTSSSFIHTYLFILCGSKWNFDRNDYSSRDTPCFRAMLPNADATEFGRISICSMAFPWFFTKINLLYLAV